MPGTLPPLPSELSSVVLEALVQATDLGGFGISVVAVDSDPPEYVFVSRSAAEMLGYAMDEFVKIPSWEHFTVESLMEMRERHQHRFDGEQGSHLFEVWMKKKDGTRAPFEVSTSRTTIHGRPLNVTFFRDVSGRHKGLAARAALASMDEKMVQADRLAAVGTLAAGIAHEINNPLAYVLLGLQYLERELPRLAHDPARLEEARARLAEVRNGAERVGTIVRDLRMFARADEVVRGPVDVQTVVEAALKIADNEIRHRATLVRDYESETPSVDANPGRLEQVFLNLIVNAAHAVSDQSPSKSEIKVSIRSGPGRTVIVEVADNGAGIPSDVLARVFDPFFTTKPAGVGTGLGLPICRGIIESFGGNVELVSEPFVRTVARVTLPARERTEATAYPEPSIRLPSEPPESRGRVLVVDDEPLVAAVLRRMLMNHDVAIAMTGQEALRAIDEGTFDAIVCDVMMPGMTGMDLYRAVRVRDTALSNRIVFMTGGAFVPRVAEFLSSIDNPKLDKPFDMDALTLALREVARRAAVAATSATGL